MKKLLSLLLVALLATLSLTLAEEAAPAPATAAEEAPAEAVEETAEETPAEETAEEAPETGWLDVDAEGQEEAMEIYMLQGTILEVQEDGLLIMDEAQGEVLVLISDETVQETGYELGVGDYVYVDYNGQMTRSLPPQVTAGRIVSHKLEGDVVEVYAEENALLLYGSDGNEYRINLPEAWDGETFDADLALEYKEKAVAELTEAGCTFPVKVLMRYNPPPPTGPMSASWSSSSLKTCWARTTLTSSCRPAPRRAPSPPCATPATMA